MFKKIIFFHEHVNGDCFQSRILVKQIIENTQNINAEYFYTANRSIISHCLDLGIPDSNFNVMPVSKYNEFHYIENNNLYINVWIGSNITQDKICTFCLSGVINKYNTLIEMLNTNYDLNIPLIESSPYIKFNSEYYDKNNLIKIYVDSKKTTYSKIVLICNSNPTTMISLREFSKYYLNEITDKYSEYLFITFEENNNNIKKNNLISIKDITNINNINYAITFSLLSKYVDKVLLLPTGIGLMCYDNNNIINKYIIFFYYSRN